jgi:hypothetical protein
MPSRLRRSINEPIREERIELTWEDRWKGPDRGLIWNWERGRQLRDQNPDLSARALAGELVQLSWKGGTQNLGVASDGKQYGSLPYLAQWQGLRGEDLDIDVDAETVVTCTVRKRTVTFRGEPQLSDD